MCEKPTDCRKYFELVDEIQAEARRLQSRSGLEDELAFQLTAAGIPHMRQVRAVEGRRFRWDFKVWWWSDVEKQYLIEIQGGTWQRERTGHSSGEGIRRDCEKANAAALAGYFTLFFTSDMVTSGEALLVIAKALGKEVT